MKKVLLPLLILLNLLSFAVAFAPRPNSVDSYLGFAVPTQTLDAYVQQRMEALNIPGLALAVINRGEIVYANQYGFANRDANRPVDEQTIFEGASISKPLFAYFVMTYVEDGRLELDRPLHQYLPHPDLTTDPRAEKITARMVLSHQSGLPNWREEEADNRLKIHFEPGTDYLYSGEGYQYLALVLREIEQTDWAGLEQQFQARVAQPLGMTHTVFIQTPHTRAHKAEPYDRNGERIDWENEYWYQKGDGNFYAASSIHSEPQDFAKWIIDLMAGELLTDASYKALFSPEIALPSDDLDVAYTLGFYSPQLPLADFYMHSGNNVGFTSWFVLDAQRDWGLVLFNNSDNGETFGEELFFYMLTGPAFALSAASVLLFALSTIILAALALRFAWKRLHQTESTPLATPAI